MCNAPSSKLNQDSPLSTASFPVFSLLVLALAAFITILTEVMPAGLLIQISQSLHVSEAVTGQLITVYALGALLAAIPLASATQGVRRRPLLLTAIAGFVITNSITAFSENLTVILVARFLAGISAGLVWALLAGFAARMVPEHQQGKAIAVAMVGSPLALSLGLPLGTWLGNIFDWRLCFALMSLIALVLMLLVRFYIPDFAAQPAHKRLSLIQVFNRKGIRAVLAAVLIFVLAHTILYTYIAPFLAIAQLTPRIDLILLIFGISSILGIWIVGIWIDRYLRPLALYSTCLFAVVAFSLIFTAHIPEVVYLAIALWGLVFGGAGTLFQTALTKTAGDATDLAQAMLVTAWNCAMALGGILGGILLDKIGAQAFSPVVFTLLVITIFLIWQAKSAGFKVKF